MQQVGLQGARQDLGHAAHEHYPPKAPVLVVEDNATIRGMLHMMLDLEGYPVHTVAGGAEALRELDAIREPRVVLLNQMLPDVDGMQVIATASSHPTLRRHRYVLMSTCSSCEVQHSVSPHTGLLLKPFSVEELLDVVEDAASNLPPAQPDASPLARSAASHNARFALVTAFAAVASVAFAVRETALSAIHLRRRWSR